MDIVYFLIISLVSASVIVLIHIFLEKKMPEKVIKFFWMVVSFILAICTFMFIISLQIGGWPGMGYGIIITFIVLGIFLVSIFLLFMQVFSEHSS